MAGGLEAIRRATNHCLAIQADEHKEEVTLHRIIIIIIIITLTVDCPLSVGVPGYVECSHGGCSRQRPCDQG